MVGQIDNVQIIYRQSCKSHHPTLDDVHREMLEMLGWAWGAAASCSIQPQQIWNYANEEQDPHQPYGAGVF